jgi:hypothetical protein
MSFKTQAEDGKMIVYDQIIEGKNLPPYWYRKYLLFYKRYRRYYGIKARSGNPMHDLLLEKIALLNAKMLYYESPDFFEKTGVPIESPLYMGKYDELLKQMVKLVNQFQNFTEPKPKSPLKKETKNFNLNVNASTEELKQLADSELDNQIRVLISTAKGAIEEAPDGEGTEETVRPE